MTNEVDLSKNYQGGDQYYTFGMVKTKGIVETPDTTEVTVYEKDSAGNVTKATGETVPSAEAGYAIEAEFIDTNATAPGRKLVNQGTTSSCSFVVVGSVLPDGSIGTDELADDAVTDDKLAPGSAHADDTVQTYLVRTLRLDWDHSDPDGNDDIIIYNANSPAMTIIGARLAMETAEGGAMTVQLRDAVSGGGNALSSALDANALAMDTSTDLVGPNNELAAGSSLVAHFSGDPGTAVGVLYVDFILTA